MCCQSNGSQQSLAANKLLRFLEDLMQSLRSRGLPPFCQQFAGGLWLENWHFRAWEYRFGCLLQAASMQSSADSFWRSLRVRGDIFQRQDYICQRPSEEFWHVHQHMPAARQSDNQNWRGPFDFLDLSPTSPWAVMIDEIALDLQPLWEIFGFSYAYRQCHIIYGELWVR